MKNAWPENRLLIILYQSYMRFYMLDYSNSPEVDFPIEKPKQRHKTIYKVSGNIAEVDSGAEQRDEEPTASIDAKYVINAAGPDYFQHRGNRKLKRA